MITSLYSRLKTKTNVRKREIVYLPFVIGILRECFEEKNLKNLLFYLLIAVSRGPTPLLLHICGANLDPDNMWYKANVAASLNQDISPV